jgi:hypothetical protein
LIAIVAIATVAIGSIASVKAVIEATQSASTAPFKHSYSKVFAHYTITSSF